MNQKVLVYGSSGALGKSFVSSFKSAGIDVFGVDFSVNPDLNQSFKLTGTSFEQDLTNLVKYIEDQGCLKFYTISLNFKRYSI